MLNKIPCEIVAITDLQISKHDVRNALAVQIIRANVSSAKRTKGITKE